MRRWLLARYIRHGTRHAELDERLLNDWCDYRPAHHNVKWVAKAGGHSFGQSCTRHVGALLIDVQRQDEAGVVEPAEHEPSRMTSVSVS